ncbi:Cytochrome c peroxidase family protein [Acidisarcina polymorpha]|uniref:Cytochrome c peroxidase family protein n=1 Tax=Acidisarcina polymorpha TaxID=2211140 RepID=A0A2Z5FUJ1_9BACT|nr:cytochrome c peroxidase [Acidisarcina polymorpha]AXC10154.1 Cytochrome c peroxidase family protein [Acidisarcina polymorpha]
MPNRKTNAISARSGVIVALCACAGLLLLGRWVLTAGALGDDPSPYWASGIHADYDLPHGAREQLEEVNEQIDETERDTLQLLNTELDPIHQIQTLGKLELFDRALSVKKNEACSTCHMPYTGDTGPSPVLNSTTAAYPGSVRSRFSARKPMSYTYATLSPVLHYNATQHDFYGGNFWDMRATGWRLQSPAAEQAQGPPTNPVEMGLPDSACVAHRVSVGRYESLFVKVWGPAIQSIHWPTDVDKICGTPSGKDGAAPQVNLSSEDRAKVNTIYDQFALSIAAYEASPEVNAFSSKFDAYLAGSATLTPSEKHGYELFNGQAKCNTCHLSGTASGATGGSVADAAPVFTDFTSSNLGVPKNPDIPYYYEDKPDKYGFVANPVGIKFVDLGVGAFLSGAQGTPVPDKSWMQYAPAFDGKVQVPTLRNVDKRPYPGFVKAYMHNGYLKSLKEVVHFYNTRDKQCPTPNDPNVKKTCWPAPEVSANEDTTVGNLGLSDADENDVVAFLKTLTDGYTSKSSVDLSSVQENIRARRESQQN